MSWNRQTNRWSRRRSSTVPGGLTVAPVVVAALLALAAGCGNTGGGEGTECKEDCGVRGGEVDSDDDGVFDEDDNCPQTPNADQTDTDDDGKGDVCDNDLDGDGTPNAEDNCPEKPNPDQNDLDGDGKGDVCDVDRDGDGYKNDNDCAPDKESIHPGAEESCDLIDSDCDGDIVDEFDDTDGDGKPDCVDADTDGDGLDDSNDNCPKKANPNQKDVDNDGKGDACDPDLELGVKGTKLTGEGSGDFAGQSVAGAGDFNGDGKDDLLIGADLHNTGGTAAGAAYLVFGEKSPPSTMSLSNADAKFVGKQEGERLGASVAPAGDVDGDGNDDILIGAWRHNGGGTDSGAAYLIYGAQSVPSPVELPSPLVSTQFVGEASDDSAGFDVAGGGDFNGDGNADLLIGAKGHSSSGDSAGAAYLVEGGSDLGKVKSLSDADMKVTGSQVKDRAGRSVAFAGDVNGDGKSDFLVGAPGRDTAKLNAGAVYLVYGRSPVDDELNLSSAGASFTGTSEEEGVGTAVAGLGDINGDGLDDFAIGGPERPEQGSGDAPAGAVYIVYGSQTLAGETSLSSADAILKGEPKGMNEQVGDRAGASLAGPGDVTGDGVADLLIGAPGVSTGSRETGAAYVVDGSKNLTGELSLADAELKLFGPNKDDIVGEAVSAAGDFDGQNGPDLLMSARGDDGGGNDSGAAYLHFGPVP